KPVLDEGDPTVNDVLLGQRAEFEEAVVLFLAAETHDVFHTGAVVPAAVEDDDLTGRREMSHVALDIHLALLAIGGGGQRHDTEYARTDTLGDRANRAALPRAVTAFKDQDNPCSLGLHPGLKMTQLDLKLVQFLVIFLALELRIPIIFLPLVFSHRLTPL